MKEEFTTSARRWYDKDPVLSSAMKTLEESDDETQIKVALNLIKISVILAVIAIVVISIAAVAQKSRKYERKDDGNEQN